MRLGQVAWTLGITEKTADNAIRTLGLARPLDEDTVRALGLALRAKHRYGIPLKRAFPMMRDALIRPELRENDAVVREVFAYLPELIERAHSPSFHYQPLRRGPGWRDPFHPPIAPGLRRHAAVRRALQWGLDLSLNELSLSETAEQRLLAWDSNLRGVDLMQRGQGNVQVATMWRGLVRAGVRCVAIGGAAATMHGSARITRDLDVCYDPATDNTDRLVELLNTWHARLHVPRAPEARLPFVLDQRTFRDSPALSLITDHGRLDLLPHVTGIGDYAACVAASEVIQAGAVKLSVLTLDALIRAKRAAGRRRDLEHLIELEALRVLRRAR